MKVGKDSFSELHDAISSGNDIKSISLIEDGKLINQKDYKGLTPLHYAVRYNNLNIVKALITAGADVNSLDSYGNNPLFSAIVTPNINIEILSLLYKSGSDKFHKNKNDKSAQDISIILADHEKTSAISD